MKWGFSAAERAAFTEAQNELKERMTDLLSAASAFNAAAEALRLIHEEAAARVRDEWLGKSQRWQESERGSAVHDWLEEIEEITLEDVDLGETMEVVEAFEAMNFAPMEE